MNVWQIPSEKVRLYIFDYVHAYVIISKKAAVSTWKIPK